MIVESYEDVIVLSGALRSNFWDTIHTAISLTLKRHPSGVIIDCSGLTEATPAGAETFRDAMQFIQDHDARIIVAAVPEAVLEVMKSVPEVRSQLPIAVSVKEARRSIDLLVEAPKKKKAPALRSVGPPLLVCLRGNTHDQSAVQLGSQIADTLHAAIVLVYVVLVPRNLPLQAPLPAQEEEAAQVLERGKAYLGSHELGCTPRLERGRDLGATVRDLAEELSCSHVVVPLSADPVHLEAEERLVRALLENVRCETVMVRGKM